MNPTYAKYSLEEDALPMHQGSYDTLNLYFVANMADDLLGYCPWPKTNPTGRDRILDGCIISAQSMPGGSRAFYDEGKTAVHEVGHWFGLLHTFQGGCVGEGDMIWDTPAEAGPCGGCCVGRDSCPNLPSTGGPRTDPVHNFMDYSDDSCMTEFTNGQYVRMRNIYNKLRKGQ